MFYVKWLLFFEISKEKVQVYNWESILDNKTLETEGISRYLVCKQL